MYTKLIGAVGTLDDVITDYVPDSLDESVQQVRPSPGMVSEEKYSLPPSAHYKQAWFTKNVKSPLPGESGSKSSAQRDDLQIKFYSLLVSQALRIRNNFFHKIRQPFDEETAVEHMWDHVPVVMTELDITTEIMCSYDMAMNGMSSSRYWIEHDNIHRMIVNALNSSAEMWSESYYPEHLEKARRGGLKGKKYSLQDHVNTVHMGATEACRALGISRRTVYNMRREFADIDLTTGELREDTTPTTQPVSAVTDRLGSEAGAADGAGLGGLAVDDPSGSTASNPHVARASTMAEESSRILLDLDSLTLPF